MAFDMEQAFGEFKAEFGKVTADIRKNAQAALEIADYAYVLESGTITLQGPGAEIAENPQVAAAYLGGH